MEVTSGGQKSFIIDRFLIKTFIGTFNPPSLGFCLFFSVLFWSTFLLELIFLFFFSFSFFFVFFFFIAFSCLIGNFCPPKVDDNGYKLLFQSCRVYARVVWRIFFVILNSEKKGVWSFLAQNAFRIFLLFFAFWCTRASVSDSGLTVFSAPFAFSVSPLVFFYFPFLFLDLFLFFCFFLFDRKFLPTKS